jgi:phosphatidate cytidylyltransferase
MTTQTRDEHLMNPSSVQNNVPMNSADETPPIKDTLAKTPVSSPKKRSMTNLAVRVITGLAILPLLIFITFTGGEFLFLFALVLVFIGAVEYLHMEQRWSLRGSNLWLGVGTSLLILLGFYLQDARFVFAIGAGALLATFAWERFGRAVSWRASLMRTLTTNFGWLYVAVPAGMLLVIRASEPFGLHWLYAILFATWGADSFAYLAGRAFGKTPLAPRFSPNKTVEGALGGIAGGIFFPALVLAQMHALTVATLGLLILAPFVAIFGDLFESWLKRSCKVKDSGVKGINPLPGHGGVLDRVDAMLFVTVLFYVFLAIVGVVEF